MINQQTRKAVAILLLICLLLGAGPLAAFGGTVSLAKAIDDTGAYLYRTVAQPEVGSIGGEWAVLGLARGGHPVAADYYEAYYQRVEDYVRERHGMLHSKKYTEYSRLMVALTAIGRDPRSVAGYDLLAPLGDFDKTIWQGINGPIWALIALDCGDYPVPEAPAGARQATRAAYVEEILSRQLADGGFSLFGGSAGASKADEVSDPDITAMALQALAKYQDREDVRQVTEEALACLSRLQQAGGGFASWGTANSESVAQVIVALGELGIPLTDSRFVKNGYTLLDNLLTYYRAGQGFLHTADGSGANLMATEQAFYAMVALERAQEGRSSLYRMSDVTAVRQAAAGAAAQPAEAVPADGIVQRAEVIRPGMTFEDIAGHANQAAIEALAARGIVSGRQEGYAPDATMTRAEFAAVMTDALGLSSGEKAPFADVDAEAWYAVSVSAAYQQGLVSGVSATAFAPQQTITRQEAAVMVARAAGLCGMNTAFDQNVARDVLAQFPDYVQSGQWARPALAFCYDAGILDQNELTIRPAEAITRGEVAQMLYNLLSATELL